MYAHIHIYIHICILSNRYEGADVIQEEDEADLLLQQDTDN
jgi:hypothetical protein